MHAFFFLGIFEQFYDAKKRKSVKKVKTKKEHEDFRFVNKYLNDFDLLHAAFGLIYPKMPRQPTRPNRRTSRRPRLVYSFGTIMAFSLIKSGICKSAVTPMRYKANDFCSLSDPDINMK